MQIVDAHNHFWQYQPRHYSWIGEEMGAIRKNFMPRDLKQQMDKLGIAACVAVEARHSVEETVHLLKLADDNPFIAGVVGWVDLLSDRVEEQLAQFADHPKLVGLRHYFSEETYGQQILSSEFKRGIGLLKQWGLTYDLLAVEKLLPALLKFVGQFPNQPFVLDHIAKPLIREGVLEPWQTHIRELAQHPQVYCKLSGLVTEADWANWQERDIRPYLEVVLDAFGPRRLMWGSDWPVCLLAADYEQVFKLVLDYINQFSAEEQALMMGQNAIDFYKLSL